MKIAIITWVFETNYGTVLQAYSLQKYLLNKGKNQITPAVILKLK